MSQQVSTLLARRTASAAEEAREPKREMRGLSLIAYDGECAQEGWEGVTKDSEGGSSAVSSCASAPLRGAADLSLRLDKFAK